MYMCTKLDSQNPQDIRCAGDDIHKLDFIEAYLNKTRSLEWDIKITFQVSGSPK
jgi:hypothetical protein